AVSAPEPSPAATAAPTAPNPPDDARPDTVREHFAPLINQPGGLTSKEAALAAAKQSPTAAAAQTKVESAQAQIEGVTWRYLPTLTLSASYTHLSPQPTVGEAQPFNIVVSETPGQVM